jgi:triacylglycerol lipase
MRRFVRVALVSVAVLVGAVLVAERVAPSAVTHVLLSVERSRSGLTAKRLKVGDVEFAYLEGGQGEPLILVHGFGADKDNFTRIAAFLTPRFRVLVPDLPGFGESDRPPNVSYGAPAQAERLWAFAHAVGARKPHLGGNSMGGMIVTEYALRRPRDVQSLWLLAPGGTRVAFDSEVMHALERGGPNPLLPRNQAEFEETMALVMANRPFVPYAVRQALGTRARIDSALHQRIFEEVGPPRVALFDDRLRGITAPTLVVWGTADRALNPKAAETYRALVPDVQVQLMDGVGHMPMFEAPEATARDYLAFRDALAARAR